MSKVGRRLSGRSGRRISIDSSSGAACPIRSPKWPNTRPAAAPPRTPGHGGEGQHDPGQRIGQEEPTAFEHQRRRSAVEEEVVPLDGGADHAGRHHLAQGGGRRRRSVGHGGQAISPDEPALTADQVVEVERERRGLHKSRRQAKSLASSARVAGVRPAGGLEASGLQPSADLSRGISRRRPGRDQRTAG